MKKALRITGMILKISWGIIWRTFAVLLVVLDFFVVTSLAFGAGLFFPFLWW